jgi:hypothetical protein
MKRNKGTIDECRRDSQEFCLLQKRLCGNPKPDEKDIQRYRELAASRPALLARVVESSELLRQQLLARISRGHARAQMLAEEDALKRDFGYRHATPMERLLIDQILTARIHMLHADNVFSEKISGEMSFAAGVYWQNFLSSAQRRYLRAIETLARVRRLARNAPLFQVNIANAGGRQINAQGELFQMNGGPSPDPGSLPISARTLPP